jgi:hypothetical protein
MATCNRCAAETELDDAGNPICTARSNTALIGEWRGGKLSVRTPVFGLVTTCGRSRLPQDARRV